MDTLQTCSTSLTDVNSVGLVKVGWKKLIRWYISRKRRLHDVLQMKICCDIRGCGSISFSPIVYAKNCTSTTNAKCSCRKGFLCSNEDCSQCVENKCPVGEQMKWTGKRAPLTSSGNIITTTSHHIVWSDQFQNNLVNTRMACCLVASVVTSQPVEILSSMVKCMRCLLHKKKKTFDVKLHNIFFFFFFFCGFVCAYLATVTHSHQAQSTMFFIGDIFIHQNHTISCKNCTSSNISTCICPSLQTQRGRTHQNVVTHASPCARRINILMRSNMSASHESSKKSKRLWH